MKLCLAFILLLFLLSFLCFAQDLSLPVFFQGMELETSYHFGAARLLAQAASAESTASEASTAGAGSTLARVLAATGGAVTLGFGIWHLFVPSLYGWLPYLEAQPEELKRGILATNFFFGVSLSILGGWSIAVPTVFHEQELLNRRWLWTMTGLWAVRAGYQIVSPQGRMIPGLSAIMLAAFIATDLLFLVPALIETF